MTDRPLVLDRMRAQLVAGVARHRARRTRRVVVGAAVALVVVAAGTVAAIATQDDDHPRRIVTNPGESTTVAPTTTAAPPTTGAAPAVTGTVGIGRFPYHVNVGEGAVWVLAQLDRSLQRVDPRTLAVDTVVLTDEPGDRVGNRIAVGDGQVWVAGGHVLYAVDADTLDARPYEIDGGGVLAVGLGYGSVWAVQFQGVLLRLDPATGATEAAIELPGPGAMDVAVTSDAVWVLGQRSDGSWLARIDLATNTLTHRTDIPDFAVRLVADERGVVVGSTERPAGETYGTLLVIDPDNAEVETSTRIDGRPEGVALAGGYVWASSCSGGLAGGVCAYDRTTLVPLASIATSAFSLAAGEGAIWAVRPQCAECAESTLTRIEPGPFG